MRKNYDTPSLPEHCYAVLPNSGQLIEVRRGEMGYYPCAYSTGGRAYNQVLENYFNAHEGISKAQAAAMLAGSMFGVSLLLIRPDMIWTESRSDRVCGRPCPGPRNICMNKPSCCGRNTRLVQKSFWMKR